MAHPEPSVLALRSILYFRMSYVHLPRRGNGWGEGRTYRSSSVEQQRLRSKRHQIQSPVDDSTRHTKLCSVVKRRTGKSGERKQEKPTRLGRRPTPLRALSDPQRLGYHNSCGIEKQARRSWDPGPRAATWDLRSALSGLQTRLTSNHPRVLGCSVLTDRNASSSFSHFFRPIEAQLHRPPFLPLLIGCKSRPCSVRLARLAPGCKPRGTAAS